MIGGLKIVEKTAAGIKTLLNVLCYIVGSSRCCYGESWYF
jgi:hypothetical protein